jgi:retron-type reverse transcriptase
MPGNGHVRFGRRAAETNRQKRRHRAATRPHNLVYDPATLLIALVRVAGNRGAMTAGVDGFTVATVTGDLGVAGVLDDLRSRLKAGTFRPLPAPPRCSPRSRSPPRR